MELTMTFLMTSFLLGVGLAMDAFSVSLANGLNEPQMKTKKMILIAGIFAFFQGLMPMIGWICVHTIIQVFSVFETFIPWIALILLAYIGGKMLMDGLKNEVETVDACGITFKALMVQGIATSIDALSVGFTIAEYNFVMALICIIVIMLVTYVICFGGLFIGKKFGTKLSNKATIMGGIILILIGLEIFITGVFF